MMDINQKQTNVLILEDTKYWQDILTEIVTEVGFHAKVVQELGYARNLLQTEIFDIVVIDLFLTEMNGALPQGLWLLDDIRDLRQKNRGGPPVIVVSGEHAGGKELQKLYDYPDIVIDFNYKQDFSVARFRETLKKAAKMRQETATENAIMPLLKNDSLDYSVENQPWYIAEFPATTEVDVHQIESLKNEIDIVLIMATDEEIKAVMRLLEPYPRRKGILKIFIGPETYYLGKFGQYRAVVTKCRMGSIGEGSVILATEQAQRMWRPRAVIMLGIAFGKDPQKQAIADVMVASQIISYEQQRVGDTIIYHGPIAPTNLTLLNRFVNVPNWRFVRPDGEVCKVHVGAILSGEKLVDNPEFKAELITKYPQAIGGEMEGAGLCAATGRMGVPWILVKAISDWGDGEKHNKHQPLATAAATSLVHYVLSQKTALKSINKPLN